MNPTYCVWSPVLGGSHEPIRFDSDRSQCKHCHRIIYLKSFNSGTWVEETKEYLIHEEDLPW